MRRYINVDSKGNQLGEGVYERAQSLIDDGAEPIDVPTDFVNNLICVINRGAIVSVGDAEEMEQLKIETDYTSKWLVYPNVYKAG